MLPLLIGAALLVALSQRKTSNITTTNTVQAPPPSGIAYGRTALEKYGPAFLKRVVEIAKELGTDPSNLLSVMYAESGLRHDAVNPLSGSVSFIQFTGEKNVRRLGERNGVKDLSLAKIKAMTPIQALEWVRAYFMPFKGRIGNVYDLYTATFLPAFVGKPMDTVMYTRDSHRKRYDMNLATDRNKDGIVTRAESLARIDAIKRKGYTSKYVY